MVVLLAAAFLSLGLVNLDFSRSWWRGQRDRLLLGVPPVLVYCYLTMPPLVFPQAFTLLLITLIPNVIITLAEAARTMVLSRRIVSLRRTPVWPPLLIVGAIAVYAGVLAALPVVDASGLRDVAGATVSASPPPGADLAHVRVVAQESAIFSGSKVIGQLGAYYRVGRYNVQSANGRLVWVAPLEFQGLVQWVARRSSPGVVVVSAENPDAPAELRERKPMRYVGSALLNDNIRRHVYFRYGTELLLEITLQLDTNGDPQYVVTLGRPTIGWSGEVVTAVVLVDPATGEMSRIPRAQFDQLPPWVSRVYPDTVVLDYNDWFGRYVHGWWNAQLTKRDVHLPARGEVYGILVEGGRFVWFVDHTSPNATDDSMTGFTYTDSRTGAMTYYTAAGGSFNSAAAERSVSANPIITQGRMIPTSPILYNIGQNTWVVPAVAANGKFQTLALVQAAGGHVVVGSTTAPSPVADAFAAYRAYLGGREIGGASVGERTVEGIVDRLALAANRLLFTLRGRREVYAITDPGSPAELLARVGDTVSFVAAPPVDGVSAVRTFHNRNVGP
jgi:hypothetical protein